jgi:hypothetical protein
MLQIDILFAFLVAAVLACWFVPLSAPQREHDGSSAASALLFFFLILFFATWAGGIWIAPVGPMLWGAYWVPFLIVGLFVALILLVVTEPSRRRGKVRRQHAHTEAHVVEAITAFGVLFWMLIAALSAVIFVGYTF